MLRALGTKLSTLLNGKKVGVDEFGNKYYTYKKSKNGKSKRWVMYKGLPEPSKVPASWHGWLHYTCDNIPKNNDPKYSWQKPHTPNLTGTKYKHVPNKEGVRAKATADYEAWKP